jgi:hypothetical protein
MDDYVTNVPDQYPSVFNIHTVGGTDLRFSLLADGLNQSIYTSPVTDVVRPIFKLTQQTEGTPAIGHGLGMQFETQTSGTRGSPVNKVGNTIKSTSTNVTPGSETFDSVFKNMFLGAAASEAFRIIGGGGTNIQEAASNAFQYGGVDALYSTTGGTSWFVGGAGNYTGTGVRNFGMGVGALQFVTTGAANIAMGFAALQQITTATNNVGNGYAAGCYITTGAGNTFLGANAGLRTITGSSNICIDNLADVPTDTKVDSTTQCIIE